MIDERMEEQASLHVLGALTPQEAYEFKKAIQANPELKAYVARLSAATGGLAGAVPMVEPPPQLRAKVLAQVAPKQKMVTLPERKTGFAAWIPWSLATGLAVLCLLLSAQDSRLKNTVASQAQEISGLNQLALSLESATNNLQQTVMAMQETNRLSGLRIAMLNSLLSDAPKAIAVSLWDNSKQEGVFVVQNLKPLPVDRDYQLWVLDNGTTPVDAGVFRVDENGSIRVDFKAKAPIKIPGKFAVTEEVRGGVASPTLENLVLASN
ncbi:MAG TPA: anti-sigma factor [Verrucomicrobiae bacterium]|jgi:anti-sigma-K factor RskA|nr:anti-sigma factor [Verrucomicrobiae bacterium]